MWSVICQIYQHVVTAVWLSSVVVVVVATYNDRQCRQRYRLALCSSVVCTWSQFHRRHRRPVHLWYDSSALSNEKHEGRSINQLYHRFVSSLLHKICDLDLWPVDSGYCSACWLIAINFMCTKLGLDSSSHFPFRVRTDKQTLTDPRHRLYWSVYPCIGHHRRGHKSFVTAKCDSSSICVYCTCVCLCVAVIRRLSEAGHHPESQVCRRPKGWNAEPDLSGCHFVTFNADRSVEERSQGLSTCSSLILISEQSPPIEHTHTVWTTMFLWRLLTDLFCAMLLWSPPPSASYT